MLERSSPALPASSLLMSVSMVSATVVSCFWAAAPKLRMLLVSAMFRVCASCWTRAGSRWAGRVVAAVSVMVAGASSVRLVSFMAGFRF